MRLRLQVAAAGVLSRPTAKLLPADVDFGYADGERGGDFSRLQAVTAEVR